MTIFYFQILRGNKISAAASDLLTNCPKITFNLFSEESFFVPRRVTQHKAGWMPISRSQLSNNSAEHFQFDSKIMQGRTGGRISSGVWKIQKVADSMSAA
jgi:hypothetical protein